MPKKLCGNCFSMVSGNICSNCGNTIQTDESEYDALPVGALLESRYVIGRILGRGGFGIIYLAYDEAEDRVVAIKEYFPYGTAVRSMNNTIVEPMTSQHAEAFYSGLKNFTYEAEIISKFSECSEILGIYDVFRQNGTAYYVMEYIKGVSLKRYVSECGVLSESQAIYIAERILPALSVMHEANVLHRDVSPDNIMICANGAIKLIDFGSAKVIEDKQQGMSVVLKQGFAPLEQYQRNGNHGSWTDLYSLGTSLYFGLTAKTPEDPLARMESDNLFSEALSGITPSLNVIIKKAASVKVENRYTYACDMLSDIRSCGITAERIPVDIEKITEVQQNRPPCKKRGKRKNLFAVIGAAVLLVMITVAVVLFRGVAGAPIEVKIGGELYSVDITELELENRELTNAQISNLRHLKKLTYLNLNNNYITDLSCLDGLSALEELHFSNNNVTDISFLDDMDGLRKLSAENNSISDISVLSDKTELEQVFLGDNYVTDISPLKNCRNLRKVGFNEAQIGNLDALSGMTELEMVCLSGCGLYDISPLSDSKGLEYVYLGRNNLSDLSPLYGCNMIELYVDNNLLNGHKETFYGLYVSDIVAAEGNGFSEDEANEITNEMYGSFVLYY